jgi:general secretion pathway protein G
VYANANGGAFPAELSDLVQPDVGGRTVLHAADIPLDPWGRPYRYEPPDGEFGFARIWTYGRDGLPGGEDDDADLGNWTIHARIEAWTDPPDAGRQE